MSTSNQPHRKRILALDLGEARIGVAISDALGWTAQPLDTIRIRSIAEALSRIQRLVQEYEVGTIILGMPLNMNGSEGPQASWVRQFGQRLATTLKEPSIVYWDERLTTVASDSLLLAAGVKGRKRKQQRDKIAAALILQSYLERLRSRGANQPSQDLPRPDGEITDETAEERN